MAAVKRDDILAWCFWTTILEYRFRLYLHSRIGNNRLKALIILGGYCTEGKSYYSKEKYSVVQCYYLSVKTFSRVGIIHSKYIMIIFIMISCEK